MCCDGSLLTVSYLTSTPLNNFKKTKPVHSEALSTWATPSRHVLSKNDVDSDFEYFRVPQRDKNGGNK